MTKSNNEFYEDILEDMKKKGLRDDFTVKRGSFLWWDLIAKLVDDPIKIIPLISAALKDMTVTINKDTIESDGNGGGGVGIHIERSMTKEVSEVLPEEIEQFIQFFEDAKNGGCQCKECSMEIEEKLDA